MATVYLAQDLKHDRLVALKVLRSDLGAVLGPARFLQEIRLAARLQHPHILPVFDSGEAEGQLWYTMPYVDGESLRERLRRDGQLPVVEALRIAREVAEALDHSHRHGVIHRDIKPENILLEEGHAVVADFGIARALSRAAGATPADTGAGVVLGSPAYMSPEQAMGETTVDGRTDIYALGCVLYEMLAGAPPLMGPTARAVLARRVSETVPHIAAALETVSPELDAVIARALATLPADRFTTAAEFAGALDAADLAKAAAGRTHRARRHLAAGIAVLALGAAGAYGLWHRVGASGHADVSPNVVAILPFGVAGAEPNLRYLRQGMIDLLAAKFTGEGGARAADARSVLVALRSAADTGDEELSREAGLEVARAVGAGLLLQGTVVGRREHLVITASLVGGPGGLPKMSTVEGPSDSLFALVDKLAAELLALGAGASAQQLSSLTTTSLDALKAYLEGQAAYRRGAFAESVRQLDRAIQLDSTFALAASALVAADGWAAYKRTDEVAELAWRYRERLSEQDRLLLSVRLGPRYPLWSPVQQEIAAAERLTQAIPESPEAWFKLADMLFHSGLLAAIPDARRRAEIMFRRALKRDSLYAPAVAHLVMIAAERRDTAELGHLVPRLLALDSSDWPAFAARWHLAAARRDRPGLVDFIARLDSVDPGLILNFSRDELGDSIGVAHWDTFLRAARPRVTTDDERSLYAWVSLVQALNRGRPAEAHPWIDSVTPGRRRYYRIMGWLVGADTAGLDAAGRREEQLAASRTGAAGWPSAPFLVEAWKLYGQDLSSVDRTVERLRSDPLLRDTMRENHLVSAQVLEAWSAAVRGSPEARRLLERADSMLLGRGDPITIECFNPLIARLYARLGATDRALSAIRRRSQVGTFLFPQGLAEASRLEGLWAARTGDRAGAALAYRRYLMFRTRPEPSKIPQRDSVRSELARLE